MAWQRVIDTVEVNLNYRLLNQEMQNTLYFLDSVGGAGAAEYQELADFIALGWENTLQTYYPDDGTLDNITVTSLDVEGGMSLKFNYLLEGLSVSTPVNTGTTFTTTFRTNKSGRSFRGRNYYCGLVENQITGNIIGSNVLTATLAFYNGIRISVGSLAAAWIWVIVSRVQEGVTLSVGETIPIISVDHVDAFCDYQRRRGEGRGR